MWKHTNPQNKVTTKSNWKKEKKNWTYKWISTLDTGPKAGLLIQLERHKQTLITLSSAVVWGNLHCPPNPENINSKGTYGWAR